MQKTVQENFKEAVTAYQARNFKLAQELCGVILKVDANHAACLHLMGMATFHLGCVEDAEKYVRQSLSLNSHFAEMHVGLAEILASQGKYVEAVKAYQGAIAIKPQHAGALFGFGRVFEALRQWPDAVLAYTQAITAKPDYFEAFNCLGVVLCHQHKWADATACFKQASGLRPHSAEIFNNLAVICLEQNQYIEAETYCRDALALRPDYIAALNNLGNACRAQGKMDIARQCYQQILAADPSVTEARNNLGLIFLHADSDAKSAADCFQLILNRHPHHVAALTHLGITLCYQGDFEQGVKYYEQALAVQPDYREALNNLGNALRATGKILQAIAIYKRMLASYPHDAEGMLNLSMALLANGDFEQGWPAYEARWQTAQLSPAHRDFPQPQWRGEIVIDKTLLIHAEQGFGDTLQFCRYVPLAAKRGIKIIMEVPPELTRLMQSLQGVETIITRGDALPDFDLHCPMLSLPAAFATSVETIPSTVPYLFAPEKRDIGGEPSRLKVGLVWAGNPRLLSFDLASVNRRRSMAPEHFVPLTGMANIDFYNLQKDGTPPENLNLINLMPRCQDFADTAALIMELDLIISVDTSVAHLAGALGKPVWLLNRYDSCWRWLHNRTDSPWYPCLRLFNQPKPGDWNSVIDAVRNELIALAASQKA